MCSLLGGIKKEDMLAYFKRLVRYRSALPFGDGAEVFDVFYLRQYNKIILLSFPFVQGSVIGPSVELLQLDICVLKPGVREMLL